MKEIYKVMILPMFILILHVILSVTGLYHLAPNVDIPMHFFGGFSAGLVFIFLLNTAIKNNHLSTNHILASYIIILSLVTTVAVLWEFTEFLTDFFIHTTSQPSIADTMADLFLGMLGGSASWLIMENLPRKYTKT